jgi:hypothetical protein
MVRQASEEVDVGGDQGADQRTRLHRAGQDVGAEDGAGVRLVFCEGGMGPEAGHGSFWPRLVGASLNSGKLCGFRGCE